MITLGLPYCKVAGQRFGGGGGAGVEASIGTWVLTYFGASINTVWWLHVQASAALQAYCQQELSSIHTTVHVAQQLHTLDMSLPTPTYQALLSRGVLSSVGLRTMGEYKLGWLKGIAKPASQEASTTVLIKACTVHVLKDRSMPAGCLCTQAWFKTCAWPVCLLHPVYHLLWHYKLSKR